jgi:hypothetical protein
MLDNEWLAVGKPLSEGGPLGNGHPFIHGSHKGESNLAAGVRAGAIVKG